MKEKPSNTSCAEIVALTLVHQELEEPGQISQGTPQLLMLLLRDMSKVFLATSFSNQVDYDTGEVKPVFRKVIEEILEALRKSGHLEVFCAVEHEGWIITNSPPDIGVKKDLEEIDNSDILLALVHDQPSAGVQFEIGYALGKGKHVFIATEGDGRLSYFNQGVVGNNLARHLSYENPEKLATQLSAIIEGRVET